jgi:hypothetical protein
MASTGHPVLFHHTASVYLITRLMANKVSRLDDRRREHVPRVQAERHYVQEVDAEIWVAKCPQCGKVCAHQNSNEILAGRFRCKCKKVFEV